MWKPRHNHVDPFDSEIDVRTKIWVAPIALTQKRKQVLAQLPQLRGYFSPNLLISHNLVKKVVTTNLVFCISWEVSV
jgi:hypothetical protein